MVKAICYTLAAIILCVWLFIFAEFFINSQLDEFNDAVDVLYEKIEDKTANREDGYAVKTLWNEKRKNLHIFVPHNDISYIDYWLNETCGLLYTEQYDLALGKVEVLKSITENLPAAYSLSLENLF